MITVNHVTLKYPGGKGIFDIDFKVREGSVAGYLGPNGAGKTTTIRTLLGFMKPDTGYSSIAGMDCYRKANEIKKKLGYIPGEIAFPSGMSCEEYLKYQRELRGIKDTVRMNGLIERFELDTKGALKKFSKGMKQKAGIIAAFMHDPEVLILDEPTSGLDPLMQNEFISLIMEEKKRGKTILMSSHMMEEVERTCDDVLIIKEGRLVAKSDVNELKSSKCKGYLVSTADTDRVREWGYRTEELGEGRCVVYVKEEEVDTFVKKLSEITVTGLDIKSQTLEEIFLNYYGTEGQ